MSSSHFNTPESFKHRLSKPVLFLKIFALILFIFSVLSLPFPFVRQVWLSSVFGTFGLLNTGLILWLSYRIQNLVYPAFWAGLGLVFHELILAGRGFLTLLYHGALHSHDGYFLIGTLLAATFLGFIFASCQKPLLEHSRNYPAETYLKTHEPLAQKSSFFQWQALTQSAAAYCVFGAILYGASFLELHFYFSICKVIAELTCVTAFYGMGREADLYLKQLQPKWAMLAKAASHLVAMSMVLWIIYRVMPIEPFLR